MLRQSCKRALGITVLESQSNKLTWKSGLCRLYDHESTLVEDHFKNPRNFNGIGFHEDDLDVGTGYSIIGKSYLVMKIKVEPETRKIVDVCHCPVGCPSVIACSSIGSEWLKGKDLDEGTQFRNTDIVKHFESLNCPKTQCTCAKPRSSFVKHQSACIYCKMPPWSIHVDIAIKSAIRDYEEKRRKLSRGEPVEKVFDQIFCMLMRRRSAKDSAPWRKPAEGFVKLNFGGSKLTNGDASGGTILRDQNGNLMAVTTKQYGKVSALKAEALALRDGIQEARKRNLKKIEIEGDSLIVIKTSQGHRNCPWEIESIVSDILVSLQEFETVRISLVGRASNVVADELAKMGHSHSSESLKNHPKFLDLIRRDALERLF